MSRRGALLLVLACACAGAPCIGRADTARCTGSELALPLVSSRERPVLILAQRVIERSWGPSEDSVYVETDVPEWRSEGGAMVLSAAVPGLGQAYAGDSKRGLWFALAEAAGWVARQFYRNRADALRDQAAKFAGAPSDSTSAWSFTRWARVTQDNPAEIEALYAADRDAFYDLIGSDPRYLAGWDDPNGKRSFFRELRQDSEARSRYARVSSFGLWLNHVTAAVDALRAARKHNLPLMPNLELKVRSDWHRGSATVTAAIERRF
jgi:hypothetical protein